MFYLLLFLTLFQTVILVGILDQLIKIKEKL